MQAEYKTVTGTKRAALTKKKKVLLFWVFLGVIFAFVDSQLPLRFDAAAFACVLASYQWGKLKEGAFRA